MVRNNHFAANRKTLNNLLLSENQSGECIPLSDILTYVRF